MFEVNYKGKKVEPPTNPVGMFFYLMFGLVAGSIALMIGSFTGEVDLVSDRAEKNKNDENWFPFDEDAFPDMGVEEIEF